jgi:hypothetical protein
MAALGRLGLALAFSCTLLGCGSSSDDSGSSSAPFKTIEPGGDTICSRGTPFRFFVFPGDAKKIVIDFRGGGACWDAVTCSISDAIFDAAAPTTADMQKSLTNGDRAGIYRLDKAENPVMGWTLVHIPYCTGDIHWGNAVVDYTPSLTIHHKGFVNASAALDYVYAHYQPDEILVTGCSAGAYGAIGHSAYIADHYPNAKITVVADSGCGVVTDDFFKNSFPKWNAQLPMQVQGLQGKDITTLSIVDLYTAIAAQYPNVRFAQQTTAFDADQTFYYKAMGGVDTDWSPKMMQSLADISAAAANFRYYMSPGPLHCLHPYDAYYTRVSEGVGYTDWLSQLMYADTPPASVHCTDTSCKQDPVCDQFKNDPSSPEYEFCKGWTGQ